MFSPTSLQTFIRRPSSSLSLVFFLLFPVVSQPAISASHPSTAGSEDSKSPEPTKPKKNRCFMCRKKVGLTGKMSHKEMDGFLKSLAIFPLISHVSEQTQTPCVDPWTIVSNGRHVHCGHTSIDYVHLSIFYYRWRNSCIALCFRCDSCSLFTVGFPKQVNQMD